jgi:troponin T
MSDEEEYSDEEVEESEIEEVEEAPAVAEPEPVAEVAEPEPEEVEEGESEEPAKTAQVETEVPKLRKVERPPPRDSQDEGQTLTEAEQAMQAAKKRHLEEEDAKMQENEARRREELATVEQELEILKQRQIERKKEREVEEAEFAERRRKDDERRRQDEENRKERIEAAKRAKEEEKLKRQQMMAGSFVTSTVGNKKKEKTAEQHAELKRNYLATLQKADISGLLPNDLKVKIKQLYQKILRLESEKYDLHQRHERQDYDLKELNERDSQRARNKALAAGVEVEQAAEGGHVRPPKVNVASKFDRQKDHRSYGDKREKFDKPYEKPEPKIAHGSGRPPPDWGKKTVDEIEALRKVMEPPKYVEIVKAEGDAAKPPVDVIPMQIPTEE